MPSAARCNENVTLPQCYYEIIDDVIHNYDALTLDLLVPLTCSYRSLAIKSSDKKLCQLLVPYMLKVPLML